MDSTTMMQIAIAVIVVLILALGYMAWRRRRTSKLQSRFGPEYDRAIEDHGDRRKAEAELHDRELRRKKLEIRPLSATERDRFTAQWRTIQAEFVDHPKEALLQADNLLTEVMKTRGYPTEDFEQRSADLSVDHPSVVQNYREGRELAARPKPEGQAPTEDFRQAMIHFRALFDELVGDPAAAETRRQA